MQGEGWQRLVRRPRKVKIEGFTGLEAGEKQEGGRPFGADRHLGFLNRSKAAAGVLIQPGNPSPSGPSLASEHRRGIEPQQQAETSEGLPGQGAAQKQRIGSVLRHPKAQLRAVARAAVVVPGQIVTFGEFGNHHQRITTSGDGLFQLNGEGLAQSRNIGTGLDQHQEGVEAARSTKGVGIQSLALFEIGQGEDEAFPWVEAAGDFLHRGTSRHNRKG